MSLQGRSGITVEESQKKYIILRTLGEGNFGKVKEALHVQSGEKMAIKILEKERMKTSEDMMRVRREAEILMQIQHPNIIELYEVLETSKYFFFMMEVVERGELSEYIEQKYRLTELNSSLIFQQILNAIEHMHSRGITHRDIKPSNILIDYSQTIKLIDFGLGTIYSPNQKLQTSCGSPCYAPPEIIDADDYEPLDVDLWSAGVSLFCMATGELPFYHSDKQELFQIIRQCKYTLPKFLSADLADLFSKLFVSDPKKRISLEGLKTHPWVLKHKQDISIPTISPEDSNSTLIYGGKLSMLTGYMSRVAAEDIDKMVSANSHNKYTTLYKSW